MMLPRQAEPVARIPSPLGDAREAGVGPSRLVSDLDFGFGGGCRRRCGPDQKCLASCRIPPPFVDMVF